MKKFKQRGRQKLRDYKDKIFGRSSSELVAGQSSFVSANNSGTTNRPVPTAALLESDALALSAASLQVTSASTSQPALPSPILPSADRLPPPTVQASRSPSIHEPTSVQDRSSALVSPSDAERSGKSTAWSGLKTLLVLLDKSADAFGPLKSAVGGILGCIDIYEVRIWVIMTVEPCLIFWWAQRAAKGSKDYEKLRAELESLFWQLIGYLEGPVPLAMTPSLVSLAK